MSFLDDFSGESGTVDLANHTPSGGVAWTRVDGVANGATVGTGGVLIANTSSDTAYRCDDQGSSDHYVQYEALDANVNAFVANRLTNKDNYIGIRVLSAKVELFKKQSGGFTLLATSSQIVSTNDIIKLVSDGSTHTVYLNDVATSISATASFNSTVTRQGVVPRYAGPIIWLDNFEAGALAAPIPALSNLTASNLTATGARLSVDLTF